MPQRITLILHGKNPTVDIGSHAVTIRAERIEIEKPDDGLPLREMFEKRFKKGRDKR